MCGIICAHRGIIMISGTSIMNFRKRLGFTQSDLCKGLNISRLYLSRIESGQLACPTELEDKLFSKYGKCLTLEDEELFNEYRLYINRKSAGIQTEIKNDFDPCILKKIRKRFKLTQHGLAILLHTNDSLISLIETGKRKLPRDLYDRLINVYGDALTEDEKNQLDNMINKSNEKIVNFVLNNDIESMMVQLIDMKLEKQEVRLLFKDMLKQAKTLKKERS